MTQTRPPEQVLSIILQSPRTFIILSMPALELGSSVLVDSRWLTNGLRGRIDVGSGKAPATVVRL